MGSWEQLEGHWDKLQLTQEEEEPIALGEDLPVIDHIKERKIILWKLCMDRSIGKEVLKSTMGKISKLVFFREMGNNVYSITFATEADN